MQDQKKNPFLCDEISLSKNGVWYHEGVEITHKRTVELFNRSIQRDGEGYILKAGREVCPVKVEDAPFFVLEVDREGDSLVLKLSNTRREKLDPSTIEVGDDNVMYALVNDNIDRAKFTRPAYYQLTQYLDLDEEDNYILRVGNNNYFLNI